MSDASSADAFLNRARGREKAYDWLGSVELYHTALSTISGQDILRMGEIHELIGYGLFRAACQADSVEEFKKRMQMSVESYEKAAELFEKVAPASGLYCRAMARYSDYWLVEDASEKREGLDDCLRLTREALEGFDAARDHLGYSKAFLCLFFCARNRSLFAEDWLEDKRIWEEMIKYGQNTIARLSPAKDLNQLTLAYALTTITMIEGSDYFEDRKTEFLSMIPSYVEKASGISEKIEDADVQLWLNWAQAHNCSNIKGDLQGASGYYQNALQQGEKLNDHLLLGLTYGLLGIIARSEGVAEEDPDKAKEKNKLAIRLTEEAIRHLLLVCSYAWVSWAYGSFLIDSYLGLAELETSLEGKRTLSGRAVEVGRKGSEYAQLSRSPQGMQAVFHSLSKAEFFLSKTEPNVTEKKRLLEEALELRERNIKIANQLERPGSWNNGVFQNYLALINADLAEIETSEDKKRHLLEEAVQGMEECLEFCTKFMQTSMAASWARNLVALGWYHDWFGEILDRLYSLTEDKKVITRAIEVHQSAAQLYQKAGMPSRVAEAYWKAARLYDIRGDYSKAAGSFEQASNNYSLVSEKIPQLKDFYHDHAVYMKAWSEIEEARRHHARQAYGQAKEHFEKASELHKSLKQWSYLAPNYSAWAELEQAEELSRREQTEEAVKSFEKAAKLFTETEESLQTQLGNIENLDEKQMATGMLKTTDLRHEYCMARMSLEEAKILDKQGDHHSSSEKYGSAAETFEKITQALDSEQDKKELRFTSTLSRAWQKMTRAEAEASPSLYFEASQLFEEAKESGPSERIKMLTLGHSRFCRALEAGTRFIDTRDAALHDAVIQHLGSAADYYIKAGFQNASEYAKATKLLFDAYIHIGNAEREADPEKKAKLYAMAEKILQTSAGSFMKAEHPEKREQVLKLLEKVKEERDLAISLSEVLHAPTIVSATTAFSTPNPTHESAVGLERFEHADIQANMITRQKELKVGESLHLEIELVNAGKGPALLTKITEVIPEGFELAERPEIYRVEDSYIDMKGKRLDPLKMVEVKLVLKPRVQGAFPIKPRVLYVDEDGKYRSHEPEPVTITVKELGIKGWIKGER